MADNLDKQESMLLSAALRARLFYLKLSKNQHTVMCQLYFISSLPPPQMCL